METTTGSTLAKLPGEGYLRQSQIIGEPTVTPEQAERNKARGKGPKRPRSGVHPIIPVSSATWWRGVNSGRYPSPHRISERTIGWRVEDIRKLLEAQAKGVPA